MTIYMSQCGKMSAELIHIDQDFPTRLQNKADHNVDDFTLHVFTQTWPSTALGFSGWGGQSITSARTYVFIPVVKDEDCIVYFAGEYAYSVPYSDVFMEDVRKNNMASVSKRGKYFVTRPL